jgi:hypothetical protein
MEVRREGTDVVIVLTEWEARDLKKLIASGGGSSAHPRVVGLKDDLQRALP